jgi:hypothetical protein
MKNLIRGTLLSLVLLAACMAHGGVSPINVTVSDAGGKAAFKGVTNAKGTFATANLKPGNYVVQFNSTYGGMKGSLYAIVVSAGTKKVAAAAVAGEKFAGGGVALRVVVGAGLNITGQVAPEIDKKTAGDTRKISTEEINRLQEHQFNNLSQKTMPNGGR